ncbi:LysM peptidoglycan-binding domain-containing protein [Luteimicrobium sp. NPDC057192]|uniref:LysM peptidoglycan-binding domain-containing protein n=1 Tax=Luteimicrobium sp. NPDC057192 TaxID=3346042 RepID=UPI00363C2A8D
MGRAARQDTGAEQETPSHARALGALAALLGLALAAPALAVWLVVVSTGLVEPALGSDLSLASRLDVLGIERLVAVPILLVGAVVAARLTVHTLLALGYVLAARAGRPLPRLRRVVADRAPAVVRGLARRAVGAGVGMSLGAGVALAGTAAAIAAPAAMAAPAAVLAHDHAATGADGGPAADRPGAVGPAVGLDLGWHDLTAASDDGARPAAAPAARAAAEAGTGASAHGDALDLGWQPLAASGGGATDGGTPRTVSAAHPAARVAPAPAGDRTEVTVRHGDTLWDIAAAHLGPHATDAEIARAWPRWYDANRDAVGADPDLLLPGTVLVAPEPA